MEAVGLAVTTELPLVIIDIQRGGPSTGLPTKTEQADLLQAVYGRNGEAPVCVIAAATPGDCFYMAIEAVRLALKYMCPVFLLTDGYLANGAEPWAIPDVASLPKIRGHFPQRSGRFPSVPARPRDAGAQLGDPGHARAHAPHRRHREGLQLGSHLVQPRQPRADDEDARRQDRRHRQRHPRAEDRGRQRQAASCWCSVGARPTARSARPCTRCRERGLDVSHAHVRYLNPFPRNLGDLLKRFDRVLVPELNNGQLVKMIRSQYLVPAESLPKIQGQPFKIAELEEKIRQVMES